MGRPNCTLIWETRNAKQRELSFCRYTNATKYNNIAGPTRPNSVFTMLITCHLGEKNCYFETRSATITKQSKRPKTSGSQSPKNGCYVLTASFLYFFKNSRTESSGKWFRTLLFSICQSCFGIKQTVSFFSIFLHFYSFPVFFRSPTPWISVKFHRVFTRSKSLLNRLSSLIESRYHRKTKKTIPLRIVFRTGLKTWKKPSIRYLIISVKQLPVLPGFSQQIYPSDVHRPNPDKSKTALNQLIKRRFPYPKPIHNLCNIIQSKEYKILIINIL